MCSFSQRLSASILWLSGVCVLASGLLAPHANAQNANAQTVRTQTVRVQTARGSVSAVEGELLVKFGATRATTLAGIRANLSAVASRARTLNAQIGAREIKTFGSIGWQHVRLPQGMSLEEGLAFYQKQPGVLAVEPNLPRTLKAVPNDPGFGQQYGLKKIGAPVAWDKYRFSNTSVVAVIDSGVNYTHEDLATNMWKNPRETAANNLDDDGNGFIDDVYGIDPADAGAALKNDPMDVNEHGTHVAGIIGARGNNATGVTGVMWGVKILACAVAAPDGSVSTASTISGLNYIVTMKARGHDIRVANMSIGGPASSQAENEACTAASNAGILLVVAAGNETTNNDVTPSYPASYPAANILSVAASDQNDNVADFSNYGATSVDLAAPGVDIYSTLWPGNQNYGNLSGTSMATPMTAGAAALLASFNPSLSAAALKKVLMDSVDPLPQWTGKCVTGGRLNLARALQAVDANGAPTVLSVSPNAISTTLRPTISINFTKPMNPTSVQANLSFTPAVAGTFVWSNNNQTLAFTPSANLTAGRSFVGRISGEALSATGVKLDGNVSQTSTGSPSDDYTWTFRITGNPPNDNFSAAQALTGDSGFMPGHNVGATRETGEPTHGYYNQGDKSVWYKWTAPATGNAYFNTGGSSFDNVLAIYTGSTVGALSNITYDSFSEATTNKAEVAFRAIAGTTYFIAVDGYRFAATETRPAFTATGNIRLNWQLYRSPSNDNYAGATLLTGTSGTTSGDNRGAYNETGENYHTGRDASVWFKWTAPLSGLVTFDTEGSPFDTNLDVFTGTPISSATQLFSDNDGGSGSLSKLPFTCVSGTTYYLAVSGNGSGFTGPRGLFKLNWTTAAAPANDLFANAQTLDAAQSKASVSGSNVGANIEAGEPSPTYRSYGQSVWYKWTAPNNGVLSLDTLNSRIPTILSVYTGSVVNALTEVAQNDDDASVTGRKTSRIKMTVVKGVTYFIRIDGNDYPSSESSTGYYQTHGGLTLTYAFTGAPSNDLFSGSRLLTGSNGRLNVKDVGASLEAGEPNPAYRSIGNSLWFKWVAPGNGYATFDTAGSLTLLNAPYDTNLAIYTGSAVNALTEITSNDDDELNSPIKTSRVRFTTVGGTTYYIRTDNQAYTASDSGLGYDSTHGSVNLAYSWVGAPSNDLFANSQTLSPVNAGALSATTMGASLEAGEFNPTYRSYGASLWYKWTAPGGGSVTFSTENSTNALGAPYNTHLAVYTGGLVNGLTEVAQNDDDGLFKTSKVSFTAQGGTTYRIRVDNGDYQPSGSVTGYDTTHGQINLRWSYNGAPITAPTLTSFSPTSGGAGTVVTLSGANLTGTNAVTFDGVAATIQSVSATTVVVVAPTAVRTGRISLATPAGSTLSTSDFRVPPVVSSYSPAFGAEGAKVVITGRAFVGVSGVKFGALDANYTVDSPTQITAYVPVGAVSAGVVVTSAGGTGTGPTFHLVPRISSFTPTSAKAGTSVTISGFNFAPTTGVLFNGASATITAKTATSLSVTVPANATTGKISVVTPYGTAVSSGTFTVQATSTAPVISSFSPAIGKIGTSVTLTGANFTGATGVKFGTVAASSPTVTASSITVTVPTGAVTGKISVTTPQGTGTSASDFVVDTVSPTLAISAPANGASLAALPATLNGTVGDNGGISNVTSLTWALRRVVSGATQTWNGSAWVSGALSYSTTPTRPGTSTTWASTGALPSDANLPPGAYTATATATDAAGNALAVNSNFSITAPTTYSISGRITLNGAALSGVTVARSGSTATVTTNSTGDFTFTGLAANSSTTLTPSRAGYSFSPTSLAVSVGTANVTGRNFTATLLTPTITGFSPSSGPVGTSVTLSGTNLSGASVKFGTVAATPTSVSATQIVVPVPNGATTGKISVTTPAGTATSASDFTVTVPTADTTKPVVTITAPANGSTATSVTTVKGTASDVGTGVRSVFLQLYKMSADFSAWEAVYNWNTGLWENDDSLAATYVVANGTASWSVALPPLGAGSYSAYVTALDGATPTANQADWKFVNFKTSAPPNNPFASPFALSGAKGAVGGGSAGATKETGEPNHAGSSGGASLWYSWTAPASGSVTFATTGSDYDTLLAVYTGTTLTGLTQIAANDDEGVSTSRVTFDAVAGTTYRIAVDGYGGATGNLVLKWAQGSVLESAPSNGSAETLPGALKPSARVS